MKKKYLPWLAAAAVIAVLLCTWAYLHVDGREIRCMDAVSEAYTAAVTKYNRLTNQETELTLSGDQVLKLKALIQESSFTRRVFTNKPYTGADAACHYTIVLELYDPQGHQLDFIHLDCIGGQGMILSAPYSGTSLNLNIRNPHWREALDAILTES